MALSRLTIKNENYRSLANQPIFITPGLKQKLENKLVKDGRSRFAILEQYGFKGGKHLIERLKTLKPSGYELVLTDQPSHSTGKQIHIELPKFIALNQAVFRALYRETGIKAAIDFLRTEFPKLEPGATLPPSKKDVTRVIDNLESSIGTLSQAKRKEIPGKLLALLENEDPNFIFQILTAVGGSSERFKLELKQLLAKLPQDKTSTKGLEELSDFMDKWNLHQITSLLSIVKARLQTIATFEQMIHDDSTYEIRGDKSIHRVLEKSMWLIDDKYWIVSSNKSLRDFIGKELEKVDKEYEKHRPDFVCVNHADRIIILEIKRPSLELKKKELDQAELYLRLVRKYMAEKKPVEVILIGNKISEEALEIAEIRTAIKIQTYQDFLERCRGRYEEYLRIVETG